MYKSRTLLAIIVICFAQQIFAETPNTSTVQTSGGMVINDDKSSKECNNIAKACLSAGFQRMGTMGKRFWRDCMGPVVLGQNVTGVNVNKQDVLACRTFKINKLKKELNELEQVNSSQ